MLLMLQFHREDFDKKYHARSNLESVFSAIKRKSGYALSSKNADARLSELLAKLLAYDITVLVHEIYEHGVDPDWVGLPPPRPPPELVPEPEPEPLPDSNLLAREIYRVLPGRCDSIRSAVTEFGKTQREP
jgi:hypothetical protein